MSSEFLSNTELFAMESLQKLSETINSKKGGGDVSPTTPPLTNGSHEPNSNGVPSSPETAVQSPAPQSPAQSPRLREDATQMTYNVSSSPTPVAPSLTPPPVQPSPSQTPSSLLHTTTPPPSLPSSEALTSSSSSSSPLTSTSTSLPSSTATIATSSPVRTSSVPTPVPSTPTSVPSSVLTGSPHRELLDNPKDAEMFEGKIVYNPDGSAYIIEGGDSDLSEGEFSEDGIIVDYKNKRSPVPSYPQIASAFYIHRNPAASLFSTGSWLSMVPPDARNNAPTDGSGADPIMHSYRVYDLRTGKKEDKENEQDNGTGSAGVIPPTSDSAPVVNLHSGDVTSVPTKPVLMCFICKLSFGFAKSFTSHAAAEHKMELTDAENEIMARKNSSAIIQGLGKSKEPLMSFLEPVTPPTKTKTLPMASILKATRPPSSATNVSYIHTTTKVSTQLDAKMDTSSPSASATVTSTSLSSSSPPSNGSKHGAAFSSPSSSSASPPGATAAPSPPDHSPHNLSDLQNNNINAQKDKAGAGAEDHTSGASRSPTHHMSSSSPGALSIPTSTSPSSLSLDPPSMPPIQGIVIRSGCEDHPNGNITGEECFKCDAKLGQVPHPNQLMHSRNSCKTLKCPKCNWHYKYQETLEIHMKEKHPENDAQCLYCMTSQPHPRLARGEVYTCGYKPYRCEVCNYSTTTKGNLSIHMQSDKHINNMQDLQQAQQGGQGGVAGDKGVPSTAPSTPPHTPAPSASASSSHASSHTASVSAVVSSLAPGPDASATAALMSQHEAAAAAAAKQQQQASKAKPSWRCDVCNYETNVARNLRIHMTSEKHTHNMMVMQQNMKHMQRDMQFQLSQMAMMDPNTAAMIASMAGMGGGPPLPPHSHAAAAASMQHFAATAAAMGLDPAAAMMLSASGASMMGPPPGFPPPPGSMESAMASAAAAAAAQAADHAAKMEEHQRNGHDSHAPSGDPNFLYQCAVCEVFFTDSVDALHAHMQLDRTKAGNEDHVSNVNGINMCQLCQYKTNLKANFQLHCKTDKHLQRLQLVNHIREAGPGVDWRLKYMSNIANPVQVRCAPCDFFTNSIHKLQLHTTNARHDATAKLFHHLRASEARITSTSNPGPGASTKCYFHCSVCNHHARTKAALLCHVRSMKHLRHESLRLMHLKEHGRQHEYVMDAIFTARPIDDDNNIQFDEDDDVNTTEENTDSDPLTNSDTHPSEASISEDAKDGSMQLKPSPVASGESGVQMCPYCNYSSVSEARIKAHIHAQHSTSSSSSSSSAPAPAPAPRTVYPCPLCQERSAPDRAALEGHLVQTHNASRDGLQKLMMLVEPVTESPPPANAPAPAPASSGADGGDAVDPVAEMIESQALKLAEEASMDGVILSDDHSAASSLIDENLRCQACAQTFPSLDALFSHQNEQKHLELKQTPRGPGYLCWKKGCNQYFKTTSTLQMHYHEIHMKPTTSQPRPSSQYVSVSEKHVYKYRCNHCSLAFKSLDKLQLHGYYHQIRAATQCLVCGRAFRSIAAMRRHVEATHLEHMAPHQLDKYRESLAVTAQLGTLLPPNMPHIPGLTPTPNSTATQQPPTSTSQSPVAQNGERHEVKMEVEDSDSQSSQATEEDGPQDSINSKALAENSYQDPNCKYKCVRCKVAFTNQKLLAQHNKTNMHRRGDRANTNTNTPTTSSQDSLVTSVSSVATTTTSSSAPFSMEKFNDPARPYKCDVCKESFTSKNIQLVHYNSVSHLHRIKQVENGGGLKSETASASASPVPVSSTTPAPTTPRPASPAAASEEPKPYKCNICKVSYSQSSGLDIHMRSVMHQKKAQRLPELAMSGEVDVNKPLIEQPEMDAQMFMQQQMMAAAAMGFLPQQPFMFPAVSMPMSLPMSLPMCLSMPLPAAITQPSVFSMSAKPTTSTVSSTHASSSSARTAAVSTPPVPAAAASAPPSEEPTPATTPAPAGSTEEMGPQQFASTPMYRFKPHVQRNLLENIGFECVMQYNEYSQRASRKDKERKERDEKEKEKEAKEEVNGEEKDKNDDSQEEEKEKKKPIQSEYEKCPCETCGKEFSSIWVLKAHQEEVHKQLIPLNYVEDFGKQFKDEFEKKYTPPQPEIATETPSVSGTPTPTSNVSTASSDNVTSTAASKAASKASSKESVQHEEEAPAPPMPSMAELAAAQQMAAQMMQMPAAAAMFGMMPGMMPGMPFPMPMGMNMMPPLLPGMMPGMEMMGGLPGMMEMPPMPPMSASASPQQPQQRDQSQHQQHQQQAAQQAAAATALLNQAKRPRTRITDDQLKVLRKHFDINNSPSEEQILKMSEQTGLQPKVIKHWFRNTLFKERQRNKDSPYNFSVPPVTQINLEEYEKTGTVRMQQVDEKIKAEQQAAQEAAQAAILAQQGHMRGDPEADNTPPPTSSTPVKTEPKEDKEDAESMASSVGESFISSTPSTPAPHTPAPPMPPVSLPPGLGLQGLGIPPPNMVASHADITAALARVLNNPDNKPPGSLMMPTSTPMTHDLSASSFNMSYSTPSTPTTPSGLSASGMGGSGGGGSGGHMSKRANRTRFTDQQLKVLQDYFEQNAYPKDDDLDHMSKMLGLSPRVIVVWFQNARQKARKNYENNPPLGLQDEESRFNRTPGLNYQCKRCHTVFQRYYELIRHQKTQCYKDEHNHPHVTSAAEDSNSSSYTTPLPSTASSDTPPSARKPEDVTTTPTPAPTPAQQPLPPQPKPETIQPLVIKPEPDIRDEDEAKERKEKDTVYKCEKCPAKFPRFDLWKEHQTIHLMNPSLFSFPPNSFAPDSAFAMLQNVGSAANLSRPGSQPQPQTPPSSSSAGFKKEEATMPVYSGFMDHMHHSSSPLSHDSHNPLKRKAEEEIYTIDAQGQKRMRTTILPEQLDYLYQQYQTDCNPSRKQIEQIAASVGLKKRVVQVWYQNTRARERKGQFRAHMQIIHKRCPVCRALFRAKSALESHLATKHPERMAKGDINVDALPDEPLESLGFTPPPPPGSTSPNSNPPPPGLGLDMARLLNNPYNMPGFMVPPPGAPHLDPVQLSMKKMYEDSLKKYLDDLSASGHGHGHHAPKSGHDGRQSKSPAVSSSAGGSSHHDDSEETPLDLSKPLRGDDSFLNLSGDSSNRRMSMDDSISETYSESAESHNDDGVIMTDYYPSSPNTKAPTAVSSASSTTPTSSHAANSQMPHKRYRTQMNSLQIKVMKAMFVDYKTPTMAECELLGREIGLAKRVVQVWFQNARAKEKKAKLNYANTFNMEVDFHRPPEECKVCNFTYSHKYTIQDHIFTKNHIARLRANMMAQGDSGTESSYPDFKDPIMVRPVSGAEGGDGPQLPPPPAKPWGSSSSEGDAAVVSHPHLAQLHAMGLQAMASDQGSKNKNTDANKNDKKATPKPKLPASVSSAPPTSLAGMFDNPAASAAAAAAAAAAAIATSSSGGGMMAPFLLPGMMPPLMPPPHMPGVSGGLSGGGLGGSGGGGDMMMYDPTVFGTPLPLLQIPAPAIRSIEEKLATAGCLITRYTQDCRDLPPTPGIHTSMLDVGYICRKCHMVFPHRPACVNHQHMFCYPDAGGKEQQDKAATIIKLEQIQYQCQTCENDADADGDGGEKFSTVAQVQAHIEGEQHSKQLQQQQAESEAAAVKDDSSPSLTPGDPAPKAQTPPPSSSPPPPHSSPSHPSSA